MSYPPTLLNGQTQRDFRVSAINCAIRNEPESQEAPKESVVLATETITVTVVVSPVFWQFVCVIEYMIAEGRLQAIRIVNESHQS